MGQLPAILKELNDPNSVLHIGVLSGNLEPLCKKLSGDEMNLSGWVSSRGWNPNEKFCSECAELYKQGQAWQPPSAREQPKDNF